MPEPLGNIRSLQIDGLLGRPPLELRPARGGPTLLTGANGSGKSTILKALEAVGTGRWSVLVELPLSALRVEFESGEYIRVARHGDRRLLLSSGRQRWTFDQSRFEFFQRQYRRVIRDLPTRESGSSPAEHLDVPVDPNDLPAFLRKELAPPEWVADFVQRFEVQFITDQRLVVQETNQRRTGREVVPIRRVVEHYAEELGRNLKDVQTQYALNAQLLDRAFPTKVVNAMGRGKPPTENQVRELLQRLDQQQSALQEVNLLGREHTPPSFDLSRLEDGPVRSVIGLFVTDTLSKFESLNPMRASLRLFLNFLNQHYRGKQLRPSVQHGFVIELDDGEIIEPHQLSSGEQQMLVLAYQILFRTAPGTLLLIDEPELSLHVLWLTTLVDDLTEMGEHQQLSFMLATHSPTLVGDRADLMRSLD